MHASLPSPDVSSSPRARLWLVVPCIVIANACGGGGGGGDRGGDGDPAPPPLEWLPAFGALPGLQGTVNASAVYDAGDGPVLYLGGDFFGAGAASGSGPELESMNLIGWDGTRWRGTAVLGGPLQGLGYLGGSVDSLAVFDDGSGPALYAGGDFVLEYEDSLTAFERENLARFDGNTWAPVGDSPNAPVHALTVFDDGTGPALYAGGSFTAIGGQSAQRIARWDGVQWTQVGGGANNPVTALAVHEDVTGGTGTSLYMADFPNVRRLDGSSWIPLPGNFDAPVLTLANFQGALIAGGAFQSLSFVPGGLAANRVVRWEGAVGWSALGAGTDDVVVHLQTIDNGGQVNLWAAGGFGMAGDEVSDGVARWDGFDWIGLGPGPQGTVRTLALYPPTGAGMTIPLVHAAGNFLQIGQQQASRVAVFNGEGWSPLTGGFDGEVHALLVDGPGFFAAGEFSVVGGVEVNGIAHWDGAIWNELGDGLVSPPATIKALAMFDEGQGPRLFAGGSNGVNQLWRWDGSAWSAADPAFNLTGPIEALTVHDDGTGPELYVGGGFTLTGGISFIAGWNGLEYRALGNGPNAAVRALQSFDFGAGPELVAGGSFTTAGGATVNHVAAYDGSAWRPLGSGFDGAVHALAVVGGDDSIAGAGLALIAAGDFSSAGGRPAGRIACWDGNDWAPLGEGVDGRIETLTVFDDGTRVWLYAGGNFRHLLANGQPTTDAIGIARWSDSEWQAVDREGSTPPIDSFEVRALAGYTRNDVPQLLVGGTFIEAPRGDSYVALLGPASGSSGTSPTSAAQLPMEEAAPQEEVDEPRSLRHRSGSGSAVLRGTRQGAGSPPWRAPPRRSLRGGSATPFGAAESGAPGFASVAQTPRQRPLVDDHQRR